MSTWGKGVTGAWLRYLKADTLSDSRPLPSSPWVAVILLMHFYTDIICISSFIYCHFLFFLPESSLINVAHLLWALILNARQCCLIMANRGRVPCFSFIKWKLSFSRYLGQTSLIPSDFAFFSKHLHYKQVHLNEIRKRYTLNMHPDLLLEWVDWIYMNG